MPERTIVAIGGLPGGSEHLGAPLRSYLHSLCHTAQPRICLVPTASGDSREAQESFYTSCRAIACKPSVLRLFDREIVDIPEFLKQQDLILVSGGNTASLRAVWAAHGVDKALMGAWEQGTVLAGWSAGALCWFEAGLTDSYGTLGAFHGGLGLLPGSFCAHFTGRVGRREAFETLIRTGALPAGLAADDGVALRFVNKELEEVVAASSGVACRVSSDGPEILVRQLAPRQLASDQVPSSQGAKRRKATGDEAPTIAYTDGACSGNPGPGGWAWAVEGQRFASGAEQHTTNQRMEVTAAYQAVLAHDCPLEVVSDSTYVVNCFKQRWWEGWLKRGWMNSQRRPVANRDLWEPFINAVRERGNVTFRWVKGHSEDRMNQFVDQLAVEASQAQRGRIGRCPAKLK